MIAPDQRAKTAEYLRQVRASPSGSQVPSRRGVVTGDTVLVSVIPPGITQIPATASILPQRDVADQPPPRAPRMPAAHGIGVISSVGRAVGIEWPATHDREASDCGGICGQACGGDRRRFGDGPRAGPSAGLAGMLGRRL